MKKKPTSSCNLNCAVPIIPDENIEQNIKNTQQIRFLLSSYNSDTDIILRNTWPGLVNSQGYSNHNLRTTGLGGAMRTTIKKDLITPNSCQLSSPCFFLLPTSHVKTVPSAILPNNFNVTSSLSEVVQSLSVL